MAGLSCAWAVLGCEEPQRPPFFRAEPERPHVGDAAGSLGLSLTLASEGVIDAVQVEIDGSALATPITRTIPIPNDEATASAQFGGLPPGSYAITLEAVSRDGQTTCAGAATFTIIEDEIVGVVVPLTCKGTNDTGEVVIDAGLNLCPSLEFFFIAPLTAPVGSPVYVEAVFADPEDDPISYAWSAAEGSFDDAAAAITTYHCDEPGVQTLTLATNDGGDCELDTHLQVACTLTSFTTCGPGEFQTVSPTPLQDRECAPCARGSYSTIDNAANCVPWTTCEAGNFVDVQGSDTSDQACAACPEGTFTDDDDEPTCTLWSICGWDQIEVAPGTPRRDTQCEAGDPYRQFGTSGADAVNAMATDVDGHVVAVGVTQGMLGAAAFGNDDAFVRKYDAKGQIVWTQQFGTAGLDYAYGVAIAPDGSVYVAGHTSGSLDQASAGLTDAYLRKYDADGTLLWARQFGTSSQETGTGVTVDPAGAVYIAGMTQGSLEGASAGAADGYVRKYDASGGMLWTYQYGTSASETPAGVALDGAGSVYVAGSTSGALTGTSFGSQDGYVRRLGSDGSVLWTRQFGTNGMETVKGPVVDVGDLVYVGGGTTGALAGANAGGTDGFVRALDSDGSELFTEQFGTTGFDLVGGLAVGGSSGVYLVGMTTGALHGASSGGTDAFVQHYGALGALDWGSQYGAASSETAIAVALDGSANVFAGGATDGALGGPNAGGTDAYVFQIAPPQ